MASEIDICNLALANLGHNAEVTAISPPDGSQEAAYCKRFYPIARDLALELHEWGFATRRTALASLGSPPDEWDYRYAFPNGIIRPLRLYEDGADPAMNPEGDIFLVESSESDGTIILTNTENAILHYTARITDTTKFTPSFVVTASWALASFLAGPLMQDLKLAEFCRGMAAHSAGQAEVSDANAVKAAARQGIRNNYPISRPRRSALTDE